MATDHLLVGASKVDVTPPFTIPYLGFNPRQGYFEGVHDPLFARAVVVGDGQTEFAIVAVDAIGYSDILLGGRGVMQALGERVQARTGIPAAHVLLSATHAHSTPETLCISPTEQVPEVAAWLATHLDQLASAVGSAAHNKRPCRLKSGAGDGRGIAFNRRILSRKGTLHAWHNRPPDEEVVDWGANDHEVGVWLFEDIESEAPVCVLSNFACHPTTVQVQPLVSADFPGLAMDVVEHRLECVSLFLQGMCGNVRPVSTDHRFADVRRHGLALGGTILGVAGRLMQTETPASGTQVAVRTGRHSLPIRTDGPDPAALRAEIDTLLRASSPPAGKLRGLREQLRMAELAAKWPSMDADTWTCRVGESAIAAIGGEPFVDYGLQIKEASPARHTLTLGYIGNYVGYLPDAQAYERGGYEVSYGAWTRLAPGAGERLCRATIESLRSLW